VRKNVVQPKSPMKPLFWKKLHVAEALKPVQEERYILLHQRINHRLILRNCHVKSVRHVPVMSFLTWFYITYWLREKLH